MNEQTKTNRSHPINQPHSEEAASDVKAKAKQSVDQAKRQAKETVSSAKETAAELASETKKQVNSALDEAQKQVVDTVEETKEQAWRAAEDQKAQATGRLHGVASALRESSHQFRVQNDTALASYTDTAAEQVEQFAGYLDSRDIGEIVQGVQDFARRQPEIFVAGALTAGFFLGRFFKSSQNRNHDQNVSHGPNRRYVHHHAAPTHDRSFNSGATAYNGKRTVPTTNVEPNGTDWGADYKSTKSKGEL